MTSPHEQALAAAASAIKTELHYGDNFVAVAEQAITAYLAALPAPDLAEWEKAAEGVTPGPWLTELMEMSRTASVQRLYVVGPSEIVHPHDGVCEPDRYNDRAFKEDDANMRWIARCSPDNVLSAFRSLSAKLAAVERERDAFRAALATACGRGMVAEAKVKALTERLTEMEAGR